MSNKNKLWYQIESKVAKILGMKRVAFSGGIWPNKEDVESTDYIVQCKSTEGKSISLKTTDFDQLIRTSLIQHKSPLFVFHIDSIKYETYRTWVAVPIDEFLIKEK